MSDTVVRFQEEIEYMEAMNRRMTSVPDGVTCRRCTGTAFTLGEVRYRPGREGAASRYAYLTVCQGCGRQNKFWIDVWE